jgi:AAA family ATP:ADP antiporter
VQIAHPSDVVVYRGSDAIYGGLFDSLQTLGLKIGAIAWRALPVVAGSLVRSMPLGRTYERRATHLGTAAAQGDSPWLA